MLQVQTQWWKGRDHDYFFPHFPGFTHGQCNLIYKYFKKDIFD